MDKVPLRKVASWKVASSEVASREVAFEEATSYITTVLSTNFRMTSKINMRPSPPTRQATLIMRLVEFFRGQNITVHGARDVPGFDPPPAISNAGFGSGRAFVPDVVGFDEHHHRIAFGIVRPDRASLDAERSLEDYNVCLDHNAGLGPRASVVYVGMDASLIAEFTPIITHYIHREYWHRLVPVALRGEGKAEA